MTEQEFYQELLAELDRAAESDKQLASLLEKIQSGQADFADSAAYWQKFSALIGSVLSQNAVSPGSGLNEEVSYLMLKNGHMRAFEIMSMVQKALDQKQNIHINPINPKFPEERARQAAHSLEDTTVSQEVIQRRAENAIANIANTFHDDYIQENANFRQKAGLKCHVSRTGASKCCAWCAEVAGRYSVGSEPADFWRRHDNCTCKISYENQRVRQQLSGNGKGWAVTSEIQRRRAQAVQYKPTVLTPEQAQTLEQQNLSRFRGLTIAGKTGIISLRDSSQILFSVTENSLSAIPDVSVFSDERINHAVKEQCRFILESVMHDETGTECTVSISMNDCHTEHQKGESGAGTVIPVRMDTPFISIHNHASNETISPRDARLLSLCESCHAVVVIGNKGDKLYILQKTDKFNARGFFDAIQEKIKPENSHVSDDQFLKESEKYGTKYFR